MWHHAGRGNAGVAARPCDEMTMGELFQVKIRIAARETRAAIQCELE
jgi:hypothetical protein